MKKIVPLLFIHAILFAAPIDPLLMAPESNLKIVLNNRVLANIHGKPITVFDLMKRMDIIFLKQFPDYTGSTQARYQFYLANWKQTLRDLIDKELIILDAKEAKMEVSQGEVRQEMEELFGPNIIHNLNKIGLSFDEASKIIQQDIIIRRMVFLRVTARAQNKVTPQHVKAVYEELAKREKPPATYQYRLITLRDTEESTAQEKAKTISASLKEKGTKDINQILSGFKEGATISSENTQTEKEIAPEIFTLLNPLKEGEFSEPVEQMSRSSKNPVIRIALLSSKQEEEMKSLADLEAEIRDDLLEKRVHEEQKIYIARLKKHFSINDREVRQTLGEEFTPFILR